MADRKVVVYEPDEKFGKALMLYFRGTGYRAVITGNHRELTRIAENNPPELFLVAVERSGAVSPELVPQLTGGGAVPVIVMSRYATDDELVTGGIAPLGAAAYLKKPFMKQQLVQVLAALQTVAAGSPPSAPPDGQASVSGATRAKAGPPRRARSTSTTVNRKPPWWKFWA